MRKHSKFKIRTGTALVGVLALSLSCAADGLRGVGVYEDNQFQSIKVSMAGGGYLNIAAQDAIFDNQAADNQIFFKNTGLSSSEMKLDLPAMTENDEFLSATGSNRLVQTAPALNTFFKNTTLEDFESYNYVDMNLGVTKVSDGSVMTCQTASNCRVRYDWSWTPTINHVVPQVIYPGMMPTILINTKNAPNYKSPNQQLMTIKVDGTGFNHTNGVTDKLAESWFNPGRNQLVQMAGTVETTQRNATSEVTAFFRGVGFAYQARSVENCMYDGTTCYGVKLMPTISSVSDHAGFLDGGQELTITGTSLDGDVTIDIDGLPCEVQSVSATEVKCITSKKDTTVSPEPSNYVGQQGVKRHLFGGQGRHQNWPDLLGSDAHRESDLWTAHDFTWSDKQGGYKYVSTTQAFESLFKAPTTGNYRFLMSCDDSCTFKISHEGADTKDPQYKEQILWRSSYTGYRQKEVLQKDETNGTFGKIYSKWVSLVEGEYYYIESTVANGGGLINLDIGMEIQPEVMPADHPYFETQVQKMAIAQTNILYDTMQIHVTNPDQGVFILAFLKPGTDQWVRSLEIISGCDAETMKQAIQAFYQELYVTPLVTIKYMDQNGIEVPEGDLNIISLVYQVETPMPLNGPTVETIMVLPISTTSPINIVYPSELQLSSPPISGKFWIECHDTNGAVYATQDIDIQTVTENSFKNRLETDCSFLKDKIKIKRIKGDHPDRSMGIEFRIFFYDVYGSLGQYRLLPVPDYGTDPLIGVDIYTTESVIRPFGESIVWEVIPAEYLFTRETEPQIIMTVDEMPVLCVSLDCGYSYIEDSALVTGFEISPEFELCIDGTNLQQPSSVEFANLACTDVVLDSISEMMTCQLGIEIPAGSWYPVITMPEGKVKIEETVEPLVIDLIITDVSPKLDLNPAGGDIITIQGSGFPHSLDEKYDLSIILAISTRCVPFETQFTQIRCETEPFTAVRRRMLQPSSFGLGVSMQSNLPVFGRMQAQTTGLELGAASMVATTISPPQVSPIGISTIDIQLAPDYPTAGMTPDDFTVTMVPESLEMTYLTVNNEGQRDLNVVAVDTTAKTLTVKYGGAYSGTYDMVVKSTLNGNIDTSAFQMTVIYEMTDFQPQEGSVFGGTKLTVYGGPFGEDLKDTIIKVGYKWWEEIDHYCYVISVTETTATCRIAHDLNREAKDYEVIAFAGTYEEATTCQMANDCLFTFLDASLLPEVTAPPTAVFDPVLGEYTIVIQGTGFTDAPSDIEFELDGRPQTVLSATATEIVVQVDTLASGLSANSMDLYFPVGIPNGYTELESGISFEPAIISLSANTVSQAGSILTAVVKGAGVDDNLTLYDNASGQDICQSAKVIDYGVLECHTIPMDIPSPVELTVKDNDSGTQYACVFGAPLYCQLSTFTTGVDQPSFNGLNVNTSQNSVEVIGDFFPPADPCELSLMGVLADSCVVESTTKVVATFDNGVPTTTQDTSPELRFVASDGSKHYAKGDALAVMQNPLSVTSVSSGLVSSFAGGLPLQITADGLSSDVMIGNSEVRVCEKVCEMDEEASTASDLICKLPAISTSMSNTEFKISEEANQKGQELIYGGMSLSQAEKTIDDQILPSISGSTAECFVGVKYTNGYVGALNEISFFMDVFNVNLISGLLSIEASSDNFVTSIEQLVLVGEEVHEGWNYYNLADDVTGELPKYQYYRLKSTATQSGCNDIGEIRYFGYEVIDDSQTSIQCAINILDVQTNTSQDLGETVTYSIDSTPVVDDIWPRWGAVSGGTQITFTGRNFLSVNTADYTITIDDVDCPIDQVIYPTAIMCTTGARIGEWTEDPKLEMTMLGVGNIALQGKDYRYCALWSEESTWGDLLLPIDGESVYVPRGLCLLVDIQNSPVLKLVLVEGTIIFPSNDDDPTYEATFDAHYIMVKDGLMEVGTEMHPYMSKLTITMYGEKYDPAMPIFGKKSIGVYKGVLDIHGAPKISWTDLDSTVMPGENELTLVETVNWEAGDYIMITSTDYDQYQAEFFYITAVSTENSKSTLTLDNTFVHKHYAAVETHGLDSLTIRAEVCLMSRNVVFRGDPVVSQRDLYGAHILLAAPGDEGVIGRIENLQLNDVGQAFQLGRYPIHFHMIGRVTKSYVKNNAFDRSYNRGTTMHGVHYLTVERNSYWDCMGHTIFIEDAAETKNYIAYNVVAGTKPSFSLLNTDTTPGAFWITHPDNIIVGNRVAGSTKYGFYMDYQDTAIGASYDPNIIPKRAKLGEFRNNVAHSVQDYGLRIHHSHSPKDEAFYEDHLSYKCGKKGVMGGFLGKVVFRNITVADCPAGIEFEWTTTSVADKDVCRVEDSVVIGRSNGNAGSSTHGIVAPKSDLFWINNVRFYNFQNGAAALGDCSHCDTPDSDSSARTTRISNLYFDPTVDARIRYRWPFKGIFHDLDGTLTEQGADSYAGAYWVHNEWPECTVDMAVYDGIVCPAPYSIMRIVFTSVTGNADFDTLYIWQYDQDWVDTQTEEELSNYLVAANGSEIVHIKYANPFHHNTAIYVTQHRYYTRWQWGLDFETQRVEIIDHLWEKPVDNVELVMPFYETREVIDMTSSVGGLQPNNTLVINDPADWTMAMNVVYNDTETREMHWAVNGRDGSGAINMKGWRCKYHCPLPPPPPAPADLEDEILLWSNPASWPNLPNRIPIEGEEVEIMRGLDVIYDIGISPLFKSIEVNGNLSFMPGQPARVNTYSMWVRSGRVDIGSEGQPFDSTVEIRLHGNNTSPSEFVFSQSIPVGNKNLIVTGTMNMYGAPRTRMTRLLASAQPSQNTLMVDTGLDYVNGDMLGLPATNIDPHNSETVIVESYDAESGLITLTEPLNGYHFGAQESTGKDYSGVDMRGEVLLLSSNVNVTASTDALSMTPAYPQPFGCQILVADFFEPLDFSYRVGSINFDNVAVYNCSQEKTEFAGLKFHYAVQGAKTVTNSAFSSGVGQGIIIDSSQNINLEGNVIHDFQLFGVRAVSSSNLVIDQNVVSWIRPVNSPKPAYMVWEEVNGGMRFTKCSDYFVTNNIVAASWHSGFSFPAQKCRDGSPHYGNVAHSISGYGMIVLGSGDAKCSEFSQFSAYKTRIGSVHMGGGTGSANNFVHDVVSIDSAEGLMILGGTGGNVEVSDSIIYGGMNMPNLDCPNLDNCRACMPRNGMWIPTFGPHLTSIELAPKKLTYLFKQGGGWGGTSSISKLTFIGFDKATNDCGARQAAISTNGIQPDFHPTSNFAQITFENTDESALFWLDSPSQGWANMSDCWTFTCTGLYNVLVYMEGIKYKGTPMAFDMPSDYQVTSNNKESVSVQAVETCVKKDSWNAYLCQNEGLGVLLFESQDADRMDRSAQPIYIQNEETGFNNRLNAYMDHGWDGAYTSQKREQRFPTFIDLNQNYTIEYTGTPPKQQRFTLYSDSYLPGVLITIPYPDAGAYKVYNGLDNSLAIPTDWDYTIEQWAVPTGRYCGENRYVGVKNQLQFWIEPGCTLLIRPRDAIMLAIRLEWTLKAFYADDGIGRFSDRMAAVLGVHTADLKVVQVYEGSVIIEFQIYTQEDDPEPERTLQTVEENFEKAIPMLGADDFGAPVMQIVTHEGKIISMEGYEDLVGLENNKQFIDLIEQFQRERQNLWDLDSDINQNKTPSQTSTDSNDDTDFGIDSNEAAKEQKDRQVVTKTEYMTVSVEQEAEAPVMGMAVMIFLIVAVVILVLAIVGLVFYCSLKKAERKQPIKLKAVAGDQPVQTDPVVGTDEVFELDDAAKPQYNPRNDNSLRVDRLASRGGSQRNSMVKDDDMPPPQPQESMRDFNTNQNLMVIDVVKIEENDDDVQADFMDAMKGDILNGVKGGITESKHTKKSKKGKKKRAQAAKLETALQSAAQSAVQSVEVSRREDDEDNDQPDETIIIPTGRSRQPEGQTLDSQRTVLPEIASSRGFQADQ